MSKTGRKKGPKVQPGDTEPLAADPNGYMRGKQGLFAKGNKGGLGRPKLDDAWRDVKTLSKDEWTKRISVFMRYTINELEAICDKTQRGEMSVADGMIARMVLEVLQGGDAQRFDFILNRTIGKVMDRVEVSVPKPYVIRRRDGSVEELGAAPKQLKEGEE